MTMRYVLSTFFAFIILPVTLLAADTGDYPAWPEMDFDFHNLSLELEVNSDNRSVSGIVEYELSPKRDDIRNLVLNAENMSIRLIRVLGEEANFEQIDDSLVIQLADTFAAGQRFKVEITYSAQPQFGVHFTANGTAWTSMLPKSNRHWLPGYDHPRVEMPVTIHIRVPDDQEAVASGYHIGEDGAEEGYKLIGWKSDVSLPLSEIGFVIGDLEFEERLYGSKRLRIYSEIGIMDEQGRNKLLDDAYQRLRETERFLQVEYPFDALTLIALNDDRWETRSYAAGVGFLFSNRGDLTFQVAHPVYSQWFGMHLRPEQWRDAEATLLYQAWLADHFNQTGMDSLNETRVTDEASGVYKNFSPDRYKEFVGFVQNQQNQPFVDVLSTMARDVLVAGDRVMGWDGYARLWYDKTGRNWFSKPDFSEFINNGTPVYNIRLSYGNVSDRLIAAIEPEGESYDDSLLVSFILHENGEEVVIEREIPGSGETLTLSESNRVENVTLGEIANVKVNVSKPFEFWLHQLRRDSNADNRKEAANAIRQFTDEPDIQLALSGVLNREDDPEVIAAVLKTISEITRGATGVQSWFLSRLDHEHEEVQRVSLRALQYYPDDDNVQREVFNIISLSEDIELVNEAISVYRHLIPEAEYLEFLDQFLAEDTERYFTETLINELYNTSEIEFANERVEGFLSPEYPFAIRLITYRNLEEHDHDTGRWAERVTEYLSDPDPRIRFLMMRHIDTLTFEDRQRLLLERRAEEGDVRVMPTTEV